MYSHNYKSRDTVAQDNKPITSDFVKKLFKSVPDILHDYIRILTIYSECSKTLPSDMRSHGAQVAIRSISKWVQVTKWSENLSHLSSRISTSSPTSCYLACSTIPISRASSGSWTNTTSIRWEHMTTCLPNPWVKLFILLHTQKCSCALLVLLEMYI